MLRIEHFRNAGFFSNSSVRLRGLINFINNNKIVPTLIDCKDSYHMYKYDDNVDVSLDFFEDYNNINININTNQYINISDYQFTDYKQVDYTSIQPYINKYFSPSLKVTNIMNNFITKYKIDTNNCIALYYRGTDKIHETPLDSYESYLTKLLEIKNNNPYMQILIQTDSTKFLNYINANMDNHNIIIINENDTTNGDNGFHFTKNSKENYKDMFNLFATFLIISKCKYIICSSSNCSIWIMLYRNNANNVIQSLDMKWL
jgi:hypothetical protein